MIFDNVLRGRLHDLFGQFKIARKPRKSVHQTMDNEVRLFDGSVCIRILKLKKQDQELGESSPFLYYLIFLFLIFSSALNIRLGYEWLGRPVVPSELAHGPHLPRDGDRPAARKKITSLLLVEHQPSLNDANDAAPNTAPEHVAVL
jgi:hypothetical protein